MSPRHGETVDKACKETNHEDRDNFVIHSLVDGLSVMVMILRIGIEVLKDIGNLEGIYDAKAEEEVEK